MKKLICFIILLLSLKSGYPSTDTTYNGCSIPDTLSQYYKLPMFDNMVELNPAVYNKYFYWPNPVFTIIKNEY